MRPVIARAFHRPLRFAGLILMACALTPPAPAQPPAVRPVHVANLNSPQPQSTASPGVSIKAKAVPGFAAVAQGLAVNAGHAYHAQGRRIAIFPRLDKAALVFEPSS